jgi:hypothetical protein
VGTTVTPVIAWASARISAVAAEGSVTVLRAGDAGSTNGAFGDDSPAAADPRRVPSAAMGVVPEDTAGKSEVGSPEVGETPGCAGAWVMPAGRLPGFIDWPGWFGVAARSRTERLGIVLDMFGVPGAAFVEDAPGVVVAALPVALEDPGADGPALPVLAPAELPAAAPEEAPAPAPAPPAPPAPPEPPPPWARTEPMPAPMPARRRSVFEFMTM